MYLKRDNKADKEDSKKIKQINKSIREENTDNKIKAILKNNKIIKKITSAFANIDMKRSGIVLAGVLAIVLLFAIIIPSISKASYVEAYQVYINDEPIGVFEDITELETMIDTIYSEHETFYDMEVSKNIDLSYFPVRINKLSLCPSKYYQDILRNNLEVNVIAWVIYVNNTPVLALEQREDAQWVLEQLLLPYKDQEAEGYRYETGFLEKVEIKSEAIDYNKIEDKETALRIMKYGDDIEVKMHKVVSGESLYSICKSYGLKLSEIKKANPSLPESGKIYKGDMLIVTKFYNIVNIKYTEYEERLEEMPYETIILPDDTMYETQKKVQQAGVVGLRNIKANVTYINGSESTYEILEAATPSRLPVNEIIVKGTIPVPAVLKLAKQGRMPLPLEDYTITSYFGKRDTGIPGASTFHKGIDLKAPYGTPIYASADGKVSFAGSSSGYGLLVKIKHDGGVETRYGHCSSIIVKSGQYVKEGEVIALVGSTGISSGNHVHFEVRINGEAVDPLG